MRFYVHQVQLIEEHATGKCSKPLQRTVAAKIELTIYRAHHFPNKSFKLDFLVQIDNRNVGVDVTYTNQYNPARIHIQNQAHAANAKEAGKINFYLSDSDSPQKVSSPLASNFMVLSRAQRCL